VKLSSKELFNNGPQPYDMLDLMPINIMFCDLNFSIQYINSKSFQTLKSIEHLIPIKAEQVIGISIDRFHKNPSHQRQMLANDKNLPYRTNIQVGDQYLDLFVTAIYNEGKYSGIMVTWDIVTEKLNLDWTVLAMNKSQAVIEFNLDGSVISANENFCSLLEYKESEIVGKHHSMFCDSKYIKTEEYKNFWSKLNSGKFDANEYPRTTKSGKIVWIQASYNPVIDSTGKIIKVTKYATDITNKKETFNNLINVLSETSNQLAAASEEFMATANQLFSNAQTSSDQSIKASAATEQINTGVRSVASNMEEMTASIKEITRTTNDASNMANETLKKSQETNVIINTLGASSRDIGNVIKVISSIAQQTNLLALNATIEAARAGDAGKGFAVVANEVKELAKQTAKATGDITKRIEAIQKDTSNAVSAIAEISISIDKVNGHAGNIAASVEEQAATSNEISRIVLESSLAIGGVSDLVKGVSKIASLNSSDASQLIDASRGLSKLAMELKELISKL
jgi:methyl-accepting chemotaxis protein